MAKLDTSSLEKYEKTAERYRDYFADEVIGRFDDALLPPNARTRKVYDEPKYTGYEVVLDVFPDVIAYGILLAAEGPQAGREAARRRLPARAGRPAAATWPTRRSTTRPTTSSPSGSPSAASSPSRRRTSYIFQDRFRTLQRKANPLKKTLFSVIVPQHQQIVDWLEDAAVRRPRAHRASTA